MSEPERSRGRPPKYPPEEVRQRLIDAGQQMLFEHGPSCCLEPVSLDAAIVDADVPRGSAYKVWHDEQYTPQNAFRRAVLLGLLRNVPNKPEDAVPQLKEGVDEFIESVRFDPSTRRKAFVEVIRQLGESSFARIRESTETRVFAAARAAQIARAVPTPGALEAIERGDTESLEGGAAVFEQFATLFELQLRAPFTALDFVTAAASLREGLAQRRSPACRLTGIPLPTGPDGEEQDWTLYGIGLAALADAFFEPMEGTVEESG